MSDSYRMMVFSGNANLPLAKAIVNHLNIPLGKALVERFGDDEIRVEIEEWAKKNPNASDDQKKAKLDELLKLEKELRDESLKAEQQLAKKQLELMDPITQKLEKAVKDVAEAKGYSVVLNKTDGSGVSIVLFGPPERNLTKDIMQKLGIKLPEASKGGR